MNDRWTRRDFVMAGSAFAAATALGDRLAAAPPPLRPPRRFAMPTRPLGRTGQQVSLVTLGPEGALARDDAATAAALVDRAVALGVTCVDASIAAANGASLRNLGRALPRHRRGVFLAVRTADRTSEGCCRDLDAALAALQTDHVDLYQIENVATMREVEQLFWPGGAMEGLTYAREQRQARFLGVTGVSTPAVLLEMLRRFPFDVVTAGINAADPHHLSFAAELLPRAAQNQVGVIATDATADGRLLTTFAPPAGSNLVPGPLSLQEALSYAWTLPIATTSLDFDSVAELEEVARLAEAFTPLADADMRAIAERTRPVARQALFHRRWTT